LRRYNLEDRIIDLSRSVYELCNEFKDLPEILRGLGFVDIVKPGMLHTAGRFMTIKKGAAMKKISLELIRETLSKHGYNIIE
jgi:N-dimethylarginine dimethylaminohydrolase